MSVDAPAGGGQEVQGQRAAEPPRGRAPIEVRIAAAFMALLPGVLIVYFSFRGGGFYPGSVGLAGLFAIQMLVLRILVADDPYAGANRWVLVVGGLFAAYTGWTLASGLWSSAADRPLIEYNRALLYLVLLVLMGTLPRLRWRAAWIARGTALGAFAICAVGLTSRVLPHVLPTSPGIANNRLSYPVTYWNALGLIAAIGALLAIGIAGADRESRLGRILAAAGVPVFAATLLFTFSRGAMLAFMVGLVAYLLVGRQRAIVGALLAIVPTTAVATASAYNADQLATLDPTSPLGVSQGKQVAVAVALCAAAAAVIRFLAGPLDRALKRIEPSPVTRRRIKVAAPATAIAAVAIAIAAGGASWTSTQFDQFLKGASTPTADLRTRLTDPSSNGRTEHWKVAFEGFSEHPWRGNGAGSFQTTWEQKRAVPVTVVDAHGLYFETLSELGIVGLVLLLGAIGGIMIALVRRARGANRGFYAALFGAGVVWAVHAGVDWDWEMPAVTAWFFAVGGAALASQRRKAPTGSRQLARGTRVPIAAALLLAAVTPLLMMLSQTHLSRASQAFYSGDCGTAQREAFASVSSLAVRPEPYQILGYCDMAQGRAQAAVAAMQQAIDKSPASWEPRYGIALARAEGGADPRRDLAAALVRNPKQQLIQQAIVAFRAAVTPEQRQSVAERMRQDTIASGTLALK
jgi:O-antigen ligase